MENLDLKQMSAMVDIIAEEKGLPKDTVLNVIEQAIAAAWRKDNGDREMNVRAVLNTKTGEADVFVAREVIEDGVGYNPSTEIPLEDALINNKDVKIGDIVEDKYKVTTFSAPPRSRKRCSSRCLRRQNWHRSYRHCCSRRA